MSDILGDERIDATKVRLRQLASIAADFYEALLDSKYPAEKACELVAVWLESELAFE